MTRRPLSVRRAALSLVTFITSASAGAGCSDDFSIEGMYRVDSHMEDETGCDAAIPVTDGPAFIHAKPDDFFGHTVFALEDCPDATGDGCATVSFGFLIYGAPIADGFRAEISSAAPNAGQCSMGHTRSDATLSGDTLTIDTRHYEDDTARSEAECTSDRAADLNVTMPCIGIEYLSATRL